MTQAPPQASVLALGPESPLVAAPPRAKGQVAAIVGAGGAFYRKLALLIWAVVVGVACLVGFTTRGAVVSTTAGGLAMGALMFGLPVQAFVWLNLRKLRACARTGAVFRADVTAVKLVGSPQHPIVDATLQFVAANQACLRVHVTGLPRGVSPGQHIYVLFDATTPGHAGAVVDGLGIVLGRVAPGDVAGAG